MSFICVYDSSRAHRGVRRVGLFRRRLSQPGTKTASGVPLNDNALTAAHKSLPFGTKVKVTNKKNGNSVTVTITDRGPYVRGRCIDVTKAGARALGIAGLATVSVVRTE